MATQRSRVQPPQPIPTDSHGAATLLVAGLAHDFNNILTGLTLSLGLLSDSFETGDVEGVREMIERAEADCMRASALARQMLLVSRPPIAGEGADLGEAVRQSLEASRTLRPSGVTVELEAPPQPLIVGASPLQIDRVVTNLCTNAWQAMPDGTGCITIRLERRSVGDRPGAVLWVLDDGTGVPDEIRDRLFEPFFSTKPLGVGSGLGLAVVHSIVGLLGGRVLVESPPVGAAFRVELPLREDATGV